MLYQSKRFRLIAGLFLFMLLSHLSYSHGMSEADKLAIIEGGNLRYMWLGATHMLSGYDHLLFVFGIIFFLTTFKDIAKYVTAFTLGHSMTLIYATFNAIQLNYFFIDAIIGLSVCYIAFANIDGFRTYLRIKPPNMMLMILGLGLIHGFGLSTRLQELPLSEDNLLLNIISFNVGIELGQIAALALMLLVVSGWRNRPSFKAFSLVTNYGLILAGGLLFLMQMHGYSHTAMPGELNPSPIAIQASSMSDSKMVSNTDKNETWKDTISITIPARAEKEYKLLLSKGATLEYLWDSNNQGIFFDFHGEPSGDNSGYFKSFKSTTASLSKGSLTTTFKGTHGWYWKNNYHTAVTITLQLKGDYQRIDLKQIAQASKNETQTSSQSITNSHETID